MSITPSPNEPYGCLLKFIIIGDSGTGKSCILYHFLEGKPREDSLHTVGVEFASKIIQIGKKRIKLQIWDTAGQERFRAVTISYYRGAAGALLVYDITRRESFNAISGWLDQIRALAHKKIVIILVGNKSDMKGQRQVSTQEGETFAAEHDLLFTEVSALSGDNILETFLICAGTILTKVEMGQIDLDHDMHTGIQVVGTRQVSKSSVDSASSSSCC